jgi:cell division protease FtsH
LDKLLGNHKKGLPNTYGFDIKKRTDEMLDAQKDKERTPRFNSLWWLILLALIIWNVVTFWPKSQVKAQLSYSGLIDQVTQNHVASVTIQGDQIQGEFIEPQALPATDLTTTNITITPTPSGTENTANSKPILYTGFTTIFPESVGDPQLIPLLKTHNVIIQAETASTPWFSVLLTYGLPILLMIGVLYWMGRQAAQNQKGIFNFGQSKARQYEDQHQEEVTFDDVAGADEAKRDLQEVVDFLRHPKKYHELGARIPRGVLLVGQPGTGKTLMARAVAGEARVPFFSLSASEFVEMFVGVGASRVRDLFARAKAAAPAIVFIDELDAVGRRRGAGLGAVNDEREQTLNQLLVEMDGFDEHHELILMAATNRPDVLDPALLRPGRFDRRIVVNMPDRAGREGILRIHTRKIPLAEDVDLDLLARTTTGFSGADLANLCNESALIAARNEHEKVTMTDFEEAVDKVLLGGVRPLLLDPNDRKIVAYHEAGHALVAWFTPLADPVHKVTIIPRGKALGVTEQVPGEDHYNYSRGYLMARLAVMLGGRTSEELNIGEPTTGAENDLVEATRLARRMVTRWAMGSLDAMAFVSDEEQPFLGYELARGHDFSEETAAHIDRDIQELLHERHSFVRERLDKKHEKLVDLANALLQEETIDQNELKNILGDRPVAEVQQTPLAPSPEKAASNPDSTTPH